MKCKKSFTDEQRGKGNTDKSEFAGDGKRELKKIEHKLTVCKVADISEIDMIGRRISR